MIVQRNEIYAKRVVENLYQSFFLKYENLNEMKFPADKKK